MKNKIILVFCLLLIGIATTFFFMNKRVHTQLEDGYVEKQGPLPCAKEGETIGSAMGGKIRCCSELQEMVQLEYSGECVSSPVPGAEVTCSDKCGNATCESWEDTCNCPRDCKVSCIKAGDVYQSPAVFGKKSGECCEGLAVIVQATSPDCAQAAVAGGENFICSACGNNACESWENTCNCPQDCKKLPKTVSVPKDDKELRSCTSSSDCQFVEPKTCCGCYEIINKKYTNYWPSSAQQDCNALDIACQMCQYSENDLNAVCIDNTCQGVPK